MKFKFSGLLWIVAVVMFTACSKKGPSYTKYIPKDASYVLAIDVKSIVTKLQKDSLSVENMLEVLKDSAHPSKYSKAIEVWNQFKDAGLDLESKVFVDVPTMDLAGGNLSVQVVAGLKDGKKLEAFVTKMDGSTKVVKEDGISYAVKEGTIIGWNDDAVMMLAGTSTPRYNDLLKDSSAPTPVPMPGSNIGLTEKLKKYFAQKKDESIASIDEFNHLALEKGDITIFTNSSSLATSNANPALAMMPKVKDLLQGIYSSTIINFEDGKIDVKGNTFIGPKLGDILKKYTGQTVDMNMVDAYPGSNVGGVLAFSFNPELIPAILKETGFDALADVGLAQQGISTADIVKAFKGDFAIIFSDFAIHPVKKTAEGFTYTKEEPTGKVVFATRINDKASFDKIVSLGTKTGMLVKQGNRLLPASNGVVDTAEKISIGIENDLLVISNDENIYKGYVAKSGKNDISNEAKTMMKGSSIAFYLDAEKILNGIPETIFDSTMTHGKNIFKRSKEVFRTFDFTTSNFDGKKIEGHGEVTMADKTNSLSQMVKFLMYTAEEMKLQDAERIASYSKEEAQEHVDHQ